jgi:hypothetical protein
MRWDAIDEMTHIVESIEMGDFIVNENTPFIGQRCHINGKGFGTIIAINTNGQQVKVRLDAGRTAWFVLPLDVELITQGTPYVFKASSK